MIEKLNRGVSAVRARNSTFPRTCPWPGGTTTAAGATRGSHETPRDAGGGIRTHTPLRARPFEGRVSTVPPLRRIATIASPRRDNAPLVDAPARLQVIRELCSHEGRLAGTDAERRAGNWLAKRLRDSGRAADVEPTYVHPSYALAHAAYCLLGLGGSLVAIISPPVGFAIVLVAAIAMYLDLNARFYLLRRLFFRRASQNVVSLGSRDDAPARVFLCAHYDAARTGPFFRPRTIARFTRLDRVSPLPLGPF